MSLHELDAFLAIVYARGAHKAAKIKMHELWNKLWGISIISETMARNRFVGKWKFCGLTVNKHDLIDLLQKNWLWYQQFGTLLSEIVFDIIDRAPISLWMSNRFLLTLEVDSRNKCQRSITNLASNFEWPLMWSQSICYIAFLI